MPGKKSAVIRDADEAVKEVLQHNIITLRKKKGLTQQQLADTLGISRETYSNYEVRTLPPQYLIYMLSKIYNVSPDVFYRENFEESVIILENTNENIYGESRFIDLTDYEKLMLMRFRLLNAKDKEDIVEQIRKKIERT